MRFRHPGGTVVHLACGANVPLGAFDDVLARLIGKVEPVRHHLGVDTLGLGLWLAPAAATALLDEPGALARMRAGLQAHGLEVVTLNGTVYAGGAPIAGRGAYAVDWSHPQRLAYTLDLVRCLARLLPDGVARGSVSTLPIGWRRPWFPEQEAAAYRSLAALPIGLRRLAEEEGRPVRIGFEPTVGCLLEATDDVLRLLDGVDRDWVGVCLDTCHQALTFEEPRRTVDRLGAAGLPTVKVRLSAALAVDRPTAAAVRPVLERLAADQSLRQVRERSARGVRGVDELSAALGGRHRLPGRGAWRMHHHVPLHRPPGEPFDGASGPATDLLAALLGGERAGTDHIEVGTQTWRPVRAGEQPPAAATLAQEIEWVRRRLRGLGLVETAE